MVISKNITRLSQNLIQSGLIKSETLLCKGNFASFGWDDAAKSSRLHLNRFMSFTIKNGRKNISLRIKESRYFFQTHIT